MPFIRILAGTEAKATTVEKYVARDADGAPSIGWVTTDLEYPFDGRTVVEGFISERGDYQSEGGQSVEIDRLARFQIDAQIVLELAAKALKDPRFVVSHREIARILSALSEAVAAGRVSAEEEEE